MPVALHISSILTKFHVFENSKSREPRSTNRYPTANEEHEPFVVYETFLKIFTRLNSFIRFLLVALYTPSVLTKFHLFGNFLEGVPGSSNLGSRRQKWPFFYNIFLKNFHDEFLLKFSCQLLYISSVYSLSFISLELPSWGTQELELG